MRERENDSSGGPWEKGQGKSGDKKIKNSQYWDGKKRIADL